MSVSSVCEIAHRHHAKQKPMQSEYSLSLSVVAQLSKSMSGDEREKNKRLVTWERIHECAFDRRTVRWHSSVVSDEQHSRKCECVEASSLAVENRELPSEQNIPCVVLRAGFRSFSALALKAFRRCTHTHTHSSQEDREMTKILILWAASLLLLFACHANHFTVADHVSGCTVAIQRVVQTSLSCQRPVVGLPPVSGADCLKIVLRSNSNTTKLCEATTMCRRETCATCDSITRTPTCHDYGRSSPGVATSCIAGSEVRTQTLCNCRCYENFYRVTEERECWELAAFSNTSAEVPFTVTLCSDRACVSNFTRHYVEGTLFSETGCHVDIPKSSSSSTGSNRSTSESVFNESSSSTGSVSDPTFETTTDDDSSAFTTVVTPTLWTLFLSSLFI